MKSIQGHLQQFKRQYFQYRFFNKCGKLETFKRFNRDIFPKIDQGGTCKNDFSRSNWDTAADKWEREWDVGGGGPSEESLKEMSELRVWYDGDTQLLVPQVVTIYQLEPDDLRWRRLRGAQSTGSIQVAAHPGEMIMEPSSAFQNSFPSHSYGAYHEALRHPNITIPATSVLPYPSTLPQNTASGPAGFIPFSNFSAFDPTRMEITSAQIDNSLFEPSRMADTSSQWAPNNNERLQDWTMDRNEHHHY